MSIIQLGKINDLLVLALGLASVYYYIWRAGKGKMPYIREVAAVKGIEEGVDRAVETDRPVIFSGGAFIQLTGTLSPIAVSAFLAEQYTAKICAEKRARLVVGCATPDIYTLSCAVYQEAFVSAGRPDLYDPTNVILYTYDGYAFAMAGLIARERPASYVHWGGCSGYSGLILGCAKKAGAMLIGGTPRWHNMAASAMFNDYVVIGDEIYAAAALMSRDKAIISSIAAGDVLKWLSVGLLVIFLALEAAGLPALEWLKY